MPEDSSGLERTHKRTHVTSGQVKLLLTVEEAAHALGISRATLYPMLMRKQIPSIRIGGSRRIPLAVLQQYVQDQLDTPENLQGCGLSSIAIRRAS